MTPQDNYGTYDRFIAFRAAVMQAIAQAWRDPKFREKFIEDPKRALKEDIGYKFPFNMDLSVDADNAEWRPLTVTDWRVDIQNRLELVLPPAPQADQQLEALAAFNAHHLTFLAE